MNFQTFEQMSNWFDLVLDNIPYEKAEYKNKGTIIYQCPKVKLVVTNNDKAFNHFCRSKEEPMLIIADVEQSSNHVQLRNKAQQLRRHKVLFYSMPQVRVATMKLYRTIIEDFMPYQPPTDSLRNKMKVIVND